MVIEKNLIKSTLAKVKKRNTRDSTLLHLMFIRDAIGMFPRLKKNRRKSNSDENIKGPKSKQDKFALGNTLDIEQFDASQMIHKLVESLEAYDALLEKIDFIAHHALTIIDGTQAGGRKPSLEVKTMAVKSAIDHHSKWGKYPSAANLCEKVRQDFFKKSPQNFIDLVAKKMDKKEVAIHRVNPTWAYWKRVDGVVSAKTISNILFELRTKSPTV